MAGSRTIKTISALIIAMFVGAAILMMVAPAPIKPTPTPVAAMADQKDAPGRVIYDTQTRLQPLKWRNLVIHSSVAEPGVMKQCHFVVYPADQNGRSAVVSTDLWKKQVEGNHVNLSGYDFNAISVGICVVGDFTATAPGRAQFVNMVSLIRALQFEFGISPDHIYLHSDLVRNSRSPGAAFPDVTPYLLQPER